MAADVGMQIKMNNKCFKDIILLEQGQKIDENQILDLVAFVDNRHDCADFRLLCLIKTYLSYSPLLSNYTLNKIKNSILNFKYWMDEPGDDGMCYWSENHQIIFATCEYLAGQTFNDFVFTNDKKLGKIHFEKAKTKILRWLHYRFLYGFTEWHSNTYYEEDISPLCVLIDHAHDREIVEKAKIVLDLLFLDLAMHSFDGYFVATSGRCYEAQKKDSKVADVNDILKHAFKIQSGEYNYERLSSMFLLCKKYTVPNIIIDIAYAKGEQIIKDSMGLDLFEVKAELNNNDIDDLGMFLWAMEAFTNKESINMTMDIFNKWNLKENNFLKDLKSVNIPLLRKLNLLPLVVKILNPATQGVAIERANTYTYKTEYYMLSSVQKYHPQEFGDQQHIWQATLPNQINIFSTHPGCPMFDDSARNFSPSYWVGNGINPHAAQDKNVLLLMYDLNARKGYLERKRMNFVHFYFPIEKFDEVIQKDQMIFGRVNDSYIGIISSLPYHIENNDELIYHGKLSHFAVVLGDKFHYLSFDAFVKMLSISSFTATKKSLAFTLDNSYLLKFKKEFYLNNKLVNTNFERYETPFVESPRNPKEFFIQYQEQKLYLNIEKIIRDFS